MWFFCLKGVCRDLRFFRCKSFSCLGYRIMLVPQCSLSYSWCLGIITHSASFTLEVSLRVLISFINGKRKEAVQEDSELQHLNTRRRYWPRWLMQYGFTGKVANDQYLINVNFLIFFQVGKEWVGIYNNFVIFTTGNWMKWYNF